MNVYIWSSLIGFVLEAINIFSGGDGNDFDDGEGNWISIALFARFLIGFGASGILLNTWEDKLGEPIAYLIAIGGGATLACALKKILRFISNSGNPSIDTISFEGMEGVVITSIKKMKPGEISVVSGDKKFFLRAYSEGDEEYVTGDSVRITYANGNAVKIKRDHGER